MTFTKKQFGVLLLLTIFTFTACRKREVLSADIFANFETAALGITPAETGITFKVKLSSATKENVSVVINVINQNILGTEYSSTPSATANKINVTIPAGNNEATVTVNKIAGTLYDGDEKLILDIESTGGAVLIGTTKQLTVSFAEIVSTSATATVNGGGVLYPNKVFIDLSSNRQTGVLRTAWDLGFYTGADDFRVILNSSSSMMAKQINKNDLTTVTAADTVGFGNEVFLSQTAPTLISLPYIDYPNGDLTRTAIATVSATATDNKVYIVNRGLGIGSPAASRGWKKVRIIRNVNGYTLQHADIASTTFTSVDITKEDATFFKYVLFETGAVAIEPQKKKWDIAWTFFTNATNFGAGEVPYTFQDMILQNRNVQTAQVLVATKSFAAFAEADLSSVTLLTPQNTIGSSWRSGGGPTSLPAVRTDRYYIIKDGENNIYKLRFTALTQNNERGYPAYEAVLVKKG
jgi:HmuY protein